jgi:hypothetical protein
VEDRRDDGQREQRQAQGGPARLPAHQQQQAQAQFGRDGDGGATSGSGTPLDAM